MALLCSGVSGTSFKHNWQSPADQGAHQQTSASLNHTHRPGNCWSQGLKIFDEPSKGRKSAASLMHNPANVGFLEPVSHSGIAWQLGASLEIISAGLVASQIWLIVSTVSAAGSCLIHSFGPPVLGFWADQLACYLQSVDQ